MGFLDRFSELANKLSEIVTYTLNPIVGLQNVTRKCQLSLRSRE